jgi:hypothetical protein
MALFVGLDVGSLSAKLAAVWVVGDPVGGTPAQGNGHFLRASHGAEQRCGAPVLLSGYRRTYGNPIQTVKDLLSEFQALLSHEEIRGMRVTGSGGRLVAEALNANIENEFKAIACAVGQLYPDVRTVFEIGGESSKYLRLAEDGNPQHATGSNTHTYATGITDYSTSGECAAGTGSFLDQQASRLKYRVEEIGDVVAQAKCAARIAGRCSVFAKSDMIHAQQKGYSTEEVLKGLCEAVSRNFKSNIVRGKAVKPRVALIGAVSQNRGVVQALAEAFRLGPEGLFVPEEYAWIGALGCALLERSQKGDPARGKSNGHFRPHLQLAGEKERDLPPKPHARKPFRKTANRFPRSWESMWARSAPIWRCSMKKGACCTASTCERLAARLKWFRKACRKSIAYSGAGLRYAAWAPRVRGASSSASWLARTRSTTKSPRTKPVRSMCTRNS